MSKHLLVIVIVSLFFPGLIFAEQLVSPPKISITPITAQSKIILNSSTQINVNYLLNRSQGLFNIDLWKDGCVVSAKQICSWPLARGRYVSLNKKENCQGENCRYTFNWALGKKPVKESGNYYLKICYLLKNQGSVQTVTCANSSKFKIEVGTSTRATALDLQMANVWKVIAELLSR